MAVERDATAWLMLAAGDDHEHGGNDGYEDDPTAHYVWDNSVQNHSRPQVGDVIVLWDKKALLGASVIEDIEVEQAEKTFRWCPHCGRSNIKARKTAAAEEKYKCYKCKSVLAEAAWEDSTVTRYTAHYEAGWVDLGGKIELSRLRQLCEVPNSQNSIWKLGYAEFRQAVGGPSSLSPVEAELRNLVHGHRASMVRVRRGQPAFRRGLVEAYGNLCAFTGRNPEKVLEAAHLYSYAKDGKHRRGGGLLLRRDVHRLFDHGLLAVDPGGLKIDVHVDIRSYAACGPLQDMPLEVSVSDQRRFWLNRHWELHRT